MLLAVQVANQVSAEGKAAIDGECVRPGLLTGSRVPVVVVVAAIPLLVYCDCRAEATPARTIDDERCCVAEVTFELNLYVAVSSAQVFIRRNLAEGAFIGARIGRRAVYSDRCRSGTSVFRGLAVRTALRGADRERV